MALGCYKSIDKEILVVNISKERNMFGTERFLSHVLDKYGKHQISLSDDGIWYPQACKFLKLVHHHISYYREKPDGKNNAAYKRQNRKL